MVIIVADIYQARCSLLILTQDPSSYTTGKWRLRNHVMWLDDWPKSLRSLFIVGSKR